MSHTPGPWHIADAESPEASSETYHYIKAGNGFIDEDHEGFMICGILTLDDARLIAAAPTGHELIQRAVADRIDDQWLKDARTYIAKTTGGDL